MQFIICPKHNKIQKAPHKVTTNCYICMNRYCQQSFIPLCSTCKPQHRDHSNKILTLEDITFLIQRLLKSPFKQLSRYIDEAVSAMKKFKLIQQNKRKIQVLEKQIFKEVICLVQGTEGLVHQYAKCKNKVGQLGDLLVNVEVPSSFHQLTTHSHQLLSNLQYNYQKDKFEYGNTLIRQKYELRRKSYQRTRRKLQQVKDYSMKIIQVILANDQSQQEEQDIVYKKKMYEILKRELEEQIEKQRDNNINVLLMASSSSSSGVGNNKISNNNNMKEDNLTVLQSVIVEQQKVCESKYSNLSLTIPQGQNSTNYNESMISQDTRSKCTTATTTTTTTTSTTANFLLSHTQSSFPTPTSSPSPTKLSIQKSSQTNSQWLKQIQQSCKQYQLKIKRIQQSNAKSINQLQNKISMLVRQKQMVKKQFSVSQQKYRLKNQKIIQIQKKLRENKHKRLLKQKQRQQKLQKLIEISNWKQIIEGDVIE